MKPIIMGADSVCAILEGRKTMTRRVIKPQPSVSYHWSGDAYVDNDGVLKASLSGKPTTHFDYLPKCPYGKVGDRLWVREIFNCNEEGIAYKATQPHMDGLPWKSPIYMPKTYSRITLEITDIRVERVQDITEADAKAEGIKVLPLQDDSDPSAWYQYAPGIFQERSATKSYELLWDSLNAKRGYPWELNPWVWVILFKRIHDQKEDV